MIVEPQKYSTNFLDIIYKSPEQLAFFVFRSFDYPLDWLRASTHSGQASAGSSKLLFDIIPYFLAVKKTLTFMNYDFRFMIS